MSDTTDLDAALQSHDVFDLESSPTIPCPAMAAPLEGTSGHVLLQGDDPRRKTVAGIVYAQRSAGGTVRSNPDPNVPLASGDWVIVKDSASFVGNQLATVEESTVVDEGNRMVSVHTGQIMAVRKAGSMELMAFGDHVLVRPVGDLRTEDGARVTEGGIVVPDTASRYQASPWREVISVPSKAWALKVGDWILFREAFTFLGGAIVTKERVITVDTDQRLQAGRIDQIVAVRAQGEERITPYFGHVLAELDKIEETTNGGIVIPDTAKQERAWGTVVDPGSVVPDLVKGDRIAFKDAAAYAGNRILIKVLPIWADEKKRLVVVDKELIVAMQRTTPAPEVPQA